MLEALVLLVGLALAGFAVLAPLWRARGPGPADDDELRALALRHRVALDALRDVEADRRSGSLDASAYEIQRADAQGHAAETRAALDRHRVIPTDVTTGRGLRAAAAAAVVIGVVLLGGSLVPATGIANETVINEALASAEAAESERQATITEMRRALAADPEDPGSLSELADAHLAGSSGDDLARAAAALQLLIALQPDRADAYERIMAAYLRAGDHVNARAAHRAYAVLPSADPAESAFFDGLIALRGENDQAAAVAAFDRFLDLAPDDPRVPMIRALRDEAAEG